MARRGRWAVAAALLSACGRIGYDPVVKPGTDGGGAASDMAGAATPSCLPWRPGFRLTAPAPISELNSPARDYEPFVTADGLTIYFGSTRAGGFGATDIWVATRPSAGAAFSNITHLPAPMNTAGDDTRMVTTTDGLMAYLASERPGGVGKSDLWFATRARLTDPFTTFALVANVNTAANEWDPFPSPDNLRLYYNISPAPWAPAGSGESCVAERASPGEPFSGPMDIPELNSSYPDGNLTVSRDERLAVFVSFRSAPGGADLWYAQRARRTDRWDPPRLLPGVNTSYDDWEPFISPDGCEILFSSNRPGGKGDDDLYSLRYMPP